MPDFEELPFFQRPDLTPYLIHLTRNTKAENGRSAFKNLVRILQIGKIRGSENGKGKGYIKGPNPAACFMDVPFYALKYILNGQDSDPEDPRYEAFGIFVIKKNAYKKGCRPVLYLSNEELRKFRIPKDELWRIVRFEAGGKSWISWLHEREWRCKGDYMLSAKPGVLVKNSNYAQKLSKLLDKEPENFKVRPRAIIPLTILCQGLPHLPRAGQTRKIRRSS